MKDAKGICSTPSQTTSQLLGRNPREISNVQEQHWKASRLFALQHVSCWGSNMLLRHWVQFVQGFVTLHPSPIQICVLSRECQTRLCNSLYHLNHLLRTGMMVVRSWLWGDSMRAFKRKTLLFPTNVVTFQCREFNFSPYKIF